MQYVPYRQLEGRPNVIVDGAPCRGTKLTLSHWPHSGTPWQLKADTSAAIVLRFLRLERAQQAELLAGVELTSNNHFDEDGLLGLWALLNPEEALRLAPLVEEVASAGDFSRTLHGDAARIAFAIATLADPERSPLAPVRAAGDGSDFDAVRYRALLQELPALLADICQARPLWADEWNAYQASLQALESGAARLEEYPEVDLVVVHSAAPLHPMAIYNHTGCLRVLESIGGTLRLHYRYETWVQLVSRPVQPRLDLSALAERLQEGERAGGRWFFDGIEEITPALAPRGPDGEIVPSSWSLSGFLELALDWLRDAATQRSPTWNPFDTK